MRTRDIETFIRDAWDIFRNKLGIQKATQFFVLIERGKGDSIKQIADYWGDASINEIHDRVMEWKSTRKIDKK